MYNHYKTQRFKINLLLVTVFVVFFSLISSNFVLASATCGTACRVVDHGPGIGADVKCPPDYYSGEESGCYAGYCEGNPNRFYEVYSSQADKDDAYQRILNDCRRCGEWCNRCSNNNECIKVSWCDPDGWCDGNYSNQRSEVFDSTCTNLCEPGEVCSNVGGLNRCVSETKPSCSVTASASPNPIPLGQSQVIIGKTGSGYTSCTGTGTFTQTSDSHTYTVNCTGNSTHSNCSDTVIVNKTRCLLSCSRCSNNKDCTQVSWCERRSDNSTYGTCANPINYNQDRKETGTNGDTCCPLDEWTNDCQCNGQYYEKKAKHYYCNNGSLAYVYEWLPYMNCGQPSYSSWSEYYCKNDDVYYKRLYTDRGCDANSSTYCYCYTKASVYQEALVMDCPATAPCCTRKDGTVACCKGTCPTCPPCSVTASASPNPIPCGQNKTTISADGSDYTSCTGTGSFTQTSQATYTVYCIGVANHSDCSDKVYVPPPESCKYKCNNNEQCVTAEVGYTAGKTYTTSNCDNKCKTVYKCDSSDSCVTAEVGYTGKTYTTSNCDGKCPPGSNPHNECYNNNGTWQCRVIHTWGNSDCQSASDCDTDTTTTTRTTKPLTCALLISAIPNPIPIGENRTKVCLYGNKLFMNSCTIDDRSTSVERGYIFFACRTFTQNEDSHIYTGTCGCLDGGTITRSVKVIKEKAGETLSVVLTANGQTGTVVVDPGEEVTLEATPSSGSASDYGWDWYIEDPDASGGHCHMTNPMSDGHFHKCLPMGGAFLQSDYFSSVLSSFFSWLIPSSAKGAVNSGSIVYQWSQPDTFNDVYVVIKKTGATATSNTVTAAVQGVSTLTFDFCVTSLEVTPMSRFLGYPITVTWDINEDNCDTNTCILSCNDANIGSDNYGQEAYPDCGLDEAWTLTSLQGSINIDPKYSGKYTYSIHCDSLSGDSSYDGDFTTDPVKIAPLPWWREIIPTLTGFLRGSLIK